jgi:hypothetical protein
VAVGLRVGVEGVEAVSECVTGLSREEVVKGTGEYEVFKPYMPPRTTDCNFDSRS